MGKEIDNIRREIKSCDAEWEYARSEGDAGGMKFSLGVITGLQRALAMLDGDDPQVDEEVEAWWSEREAGERAGE